MKKRIKIYQSYNDYKVYKIEEYSGKYYVKRFEALGFISDDWKDIGTAKSLEDAVSMARVDALSFGAIYKMEYD